MLDRKASAFGRLLSDATNQVRDEQDSKFAAEWNSKEESSRLRRRYMEEKAGEKLAYELSKEEVVMVGDPFYRIAPGKENIRSVRNDFDEIRSNELYSQDESKACSTMRRKDKITMEEADARLADEMHRSMIKEDSDAKAALEEMDLEYARKEHDKILAEIKLQEEKDNKLAKRLAKNMAREEHRRMKASEFLAINLTQDKSWNHGNISVEDINGGVVMSMYLPGATDIHVGCRMKNVVFLDARRGSTKEVFGLDVMLSGVEIRNAEVSFEYSSETSVLFVYVDGVHLRDQDSSILSDLKKRLARGLRRLLGNDP